MTADAALPPLGQRILWPMNKRDALYLDVADFLSMTGPTLLAKIRGQLNFTGLELAKLSEYLGVRTDAWFQPTWDDFIDRQRSHSEIEEIALLLKDLDYSCDPHDPVNMLNTCVGAFTEGKIGVRILIRAVNIFGPMIVGEDK